MSLYFLNLAIGLPILIWGAILVLRRRTKKHVLIYALVAGLYFIWVASIFIWTVKRPY